MLNKSHTPLLPVIRECTQKFKTTFIRYRKKKEMLDYKNNYMMIDSANK